MKGKRTPIHAVATWVRKQPPKVKAFLAVASGIVAVIFLRMVVRDHDSLFVAAEAVHALGISILIYKLTKERTCAGTFSFCIPLLIYFLFCLYSVVLLFFFPFIGFDFGFIFSFYRFRIRIIVLCFFPSYFNSYWERFCLFGCKKISWGKRKRDNLLESHYFSSDSRIEQAL